MNDEIMRIAEIYDNYQKAVSYGCEYPAAWADSLAKRKRAFCLFLQAEGGRRSMLSHPTIVCYVEMLGACSCFVQQFLKVDRDFYEMLNNVEIARLLELMKSNGSYQMFSNILSCNPQTVINRYLDFIERYN